MPDQVPAEVVGERFQRLVALQERIALECNRALVGTEVELLVERASSKTDATRMSGRTRTNKLCHFPVPALGEVGDRRIDASSGLTAAPAGIAPGDLVTVRVEHAAPHHLLAGPVLTHRPRSSAASSCAAAPPPRPLPAGAVPLPLVG
jgi:tRNA-2-methylthio-N6-dimethylallyladenosine synthase